MVRQRVWSILTLVASAVLAASYAVAAEVTPDFANDADNWEQLNPSIGLQGAPALWIAYLPDKAGAEGEGGLRLYVRIEQHAALVQAPSVAWFSAPGDARQNPFKAIVAVRQHKNPLYKNISPNDADLQLRTPPAIYEYAIKPDAQNAATGIYAMRIAFPSVYGDVEYPFKLPFIKNKDAAGSIEITSVRPQPVPISADRPTEIRVTITNKSVYRIRVTKCRVNDNDGLLSSETAGKWLKVDPPVLVDAGADGVISIRNLRGEWDGIIHPVGSDPQLKVTVGYDVLYEGHIVRQDHEAEGLQAITYSVQYSFFWTMGCVAFGLLGGLMAKRWYDNTAWKDMFKAYAGVLILSMIIFGLCAIYGVELVSERKLRLFSFNNPISGLILGAIIGIDPRKAIDAFKNKTNLGGGGGAGPAPAPPAGPAPAGGSGQ
jgi:hypothetical protein